MSLLSGASANRNFDAHDPSEVAEGLSMLGFGLQDLDLGERGHVTSTGIPGMIALNAAAFMSAPAVKFCADIFIGGVCIPS
jgi:hypothetical protein